MTIVRMTALATSILVALGLITAQAAAQDKPEATPVDGKIDWQFDYAQAQFLSAQTGRPMFVVIRCER